jgi:hypothetical protein
MKTKLITAVLLIVSAAAMAEFDAHSKTRFVTSRYKGRIYESCITADQFDKMPAWDSTGKKPIPVSPGRAISLARAVFEKHVPKAERHNWVISHVELRHYDDVWPPRAYVEVRKQKWYYVVTFWNKTNPTVAALPTPPEIKAKQEEFNIFVLLSGEVSNPAPRVTKNDSEQTPERDK